MCCSFLCSWKTLFFWWSGVWLRWRQQTIWLEQSTKSLWNWQLDKDSSSTIVGNHWNWWYVSSRSLSGNDESDHSGFILSCWCLPYHSWGFSHYYGQCKTSSWLGSTIFGGSLFNEKRGNHLSSTILSRSLSSGKLLWISKVLLERWSCCLPKQQSSSHFWSDFQSTIWSFQIILWTLWIFVDFLLILNKVYSLVYMISVLKCIKRNVQLKSFFQVTSSIKS